MKNVRFAVIGLGARGFGLMGKAVMPVEGVEIVGLCDILPDRVERARAVAEEADGITQKNHFFHFYDHSFLNHAEGLCRFRLCRNGGFVNRQGTKLPV